MAGDEAVAVVQEGPVFMDRQATIDKAIHLIEVSAKNGAQLITFPEAFLPGYPEWGGRLRPKAESELAAQIHERLVREAVDIQRGDLEPICAAAKRAGVTVCLGLEEIDRVHAAGTIYNTLVTIGAGGRILNKHRKLTPTYDERLSWAPGDASGLRAVDTPAGRVAGLICWENYVPLARFALYSEGVQIYVAPTWDCGDSWIRAMRFIAVEGGCWVLGNGTPMQKRDVPTDFPGRDLLFPEAENDWINSGDSVIVSPTGAIVAGPLHDARGTLYANCDLTASAEGHRLRDLTGHYGRPDIFSLVVDREPRRAVAWKTGVTHEDNAV